MRIVARLLTAALFVATLTGAAPRDLTGKVVGVSDGDTLTLLTPQRRQVKVRLDQIDAPESSQPGGAAAKRRLSALAYGKTATVRVSTQDRYGRSVGEVRVDGVDVNAALVRDGNAWAYRDYLRDPKLLQLEKEARVARRGLWAAAPPQPTAPWEWRKARRTPASTPIRTAACAKRYCRQMNSCAEARKALKQCGFGNLDADGDGTPCESVCRVG